VFVSINGVSVEYAMEAISLAGTVLAIMSKEGVVMVAEKVSRTDAMGFSFFRSFGLDGLIFSLQSFFLSLPPSSHTLFHNLHQSIPLPSPTSQKVTGKLLDLSLTSAGGGGEGTEAWTGGGGGEKIFLLNKCVCATGVCG
jgi:hypothetical protein